MSNAYEPSLEELMHYGVKGMKWGVRKERQPMSPETKRRIKQGAIAAGVVLATAGAVSVAVATKNERASQAALNQMLGPAFRWKDQAGNWSQFVTDASGNTLGAYGIVNR